MYPRDLRYGLGSELFPCLGELAVCGIVLASRERTECGTARPGYSSTVTEIRLWSESGFSESRGSWMQTDPGRTRSATGALRRM